jgi:hypothetical protein
MTLNEYANDRENVVLFWAGVGTPAGDYAPLGHPDLDFADRRGLLDLTGTVDTDGDWHWDGKGSPTDGRANSITKLHAYADAKVWASLVKEYEEAV